ncbi:MAG TPA: SDR family NAD(P)-dependent oxidoreductase, partial [Kofleriaceae bacterium]|nr:SDR family NAD(P)-dependent oxidoreductase [Kofleriaceae bacterium]
MPQENDLASRVCVITGANTGIGRATAEALANRGARVILACRSEDKARPVIADIARATGDDSRAGFLALDLSDLGSVRRAANELGEREPK